jgi:NAD(P)-dependent dehydrogenase (short-subunit alcohol dehydrogenase family)
MRNDVTRDLERKTALVTGGTRNLGRGMAERLAASGAVVAVNYAGDVEAAEATVAAIAAAGGEAFAIKARLGAPGANEAVVEALVPELKRRTGRDGLDILVNNIGGGDYATIATTTPEQYDQTFANNVRSPFFLTQALLPHLSDGGRIINISSVASRLAGTDFIVYSMSKAALDMFTRVLAKELGPRRINVNAVLPGFNVTDANADILADPEARKQVEGLTLLGRFGEPGDIAEVVHFLASPGGRWVTGQIIEASGGFRF